MGAFIDQTLYAQDKIGAAVLNAPSDFGLTPTSSTPRMWDTPSTESSYLPNHNTAITPTS
jgi:hypothetical protein